MKLFYRTYGSGQPLIILHGLMGTADNWNTLAKQYGEEYQTIVVDQRNHGQSPHSDEWNYTVMAEDIVELMNDLGLDKAHLMGHSMGGKTVMFFSMLFPERLNKLIVSDISPRYYPPHHQDILAALGSVGLNSVSSRKEVEQILTERIPDAGTRQFLLKSLYWKDDKLAWRFNLDVIREQIENIGEVIPKGTFEGDVLFVRGARSSYINDSDWEAIRKIYPNARLATIPSGHWIHAEKPQEYFVVTSEFLRK